MIYFSTKTQDCHAFHIRENIPTPEEYTVHAHMTRIELLCVVCGKLRYHVEGNVYTVHPGDLVMTAPGETHYTEVDPSVPYERMAAMFDPRMLSGLDPEGKLTRAILQKKPGVRNLFTAKEAGNLSWPERMSRFLTDAPELSLNTVAGISLLLQQILSVLSADEAEPAPECLGAQLLRYVTNNLSQPLALQDLSDHFYLSRAHLCRIFRSAAGTSVGRYITTKRMLLARQLIGQGNKPTNIYQQCGYRDYSTFFRAYCKFHGHPPKDDLATAHSEDDTISLQ